MNVRESSSNVEIFIAEATARMKKLTGRLAETWGLGASASALGALLLLSGIVLMFHYRPMTALAWADVVDLREASAVGALRGLHYWSAQILVLVLWLHLLRVFLGGRHRAARRGNWMVGVLLLVTTLAMAATGHLLPWDQQAVSAWALQHPSPSPPPASPPSELGDGHLLWVYAAHCVVLPLVAAALIVEHRRRHRRDRSHR